MHIFTQQDFKKHLEQAAIYYCYYQTPAGLLRILSTDLGIYKTEFVPMDVDITGYTRVNAPPSKAYILVGTQFQILVWQAALTIPQGQTAHYKQIARHIGYPTAARAVANALKHNKIAYFIPCHRVLRANKDICGYNWGVERKIQLLEAEGITLHAKTS